MTHANFAQSVAPRPGPIFSHPNALRIFGPAGAGKTASVVQLLRQHVEDGDFDIQDAVICSFTRTASRDIARRVRDDGDTEQSRYHCTLHAFVKRYYGFDSDIADTRLKEFFSAEGIDYEGGRPGDPEEWNTSETEGQTEGAQIIGFWSKCRNRMIPFEQGRREYAAPSELASWWVGDRLDRLWHKYVAWKAANNLIDFTDMLEMALQSPPGASWPCFVLDEAQDSTPLQWAVANSIASRCDIAYIAGDDDQAVYEWSGASPREFLDAEVAAEDTLRVNYRCSSRILDEAQTLIRRNRLRHDKAMIAANEGGRIDRVHDLPPLEIGESTFVMGRAHYLLDGAMTELERRGYPFFDHRRKRGVNGTAATAFRRWHELAKGGRISVDEWRLLCEKTIPSRGPWLVHGTKARLAKLDPAFRRETYVSADRLYIYGGTEELVNAIKARSVEPLGGIPAQRRAYFRDVTVKHGPEYLEEAAAARVCQVGPIHAYKGLECDHVVLHSGMPPAATREALFDPEPERRVFYVGITRAKTRLTHLQGPAFAQWAEVV